jgi:hypothetical protein
MNASKSFAIFFALCIFVLSSCSQPTGGGNNEDQEALTAITSYAAYHLKLVMMNYFKIVSLFQNP